VAHTPNKLNSVLPIFTHVGLTSSHLRPNPGFSYAYAADGARMAPVLYQALSSLVEAAHLELVVKPTVELRDNMQPAFGCRGVLLYTHFITQL
jgi:hypothetical protein